MLNVIFFQDTSKNPREKNFTPHCVVPMTEGYSQIYECTKR